MILFGTPTYDKSVTLDYHTSLLQSTHLLSQRGVDWTTHVVAGKCFIDLARNEIVHAFLHSGASDLLFVDADVGWDPKVLPRLLNYPHGVVAGLVPKRDAESDATFHQNALTGVIDQGLFQSLEAPTAFMRIKRSVFQRLDEAYPELARADRESKFTPYFQTGIKNGGFLGEDIFFCRQWCALGEFIWIDPDISFSHRGSRVWKGNFYDHCKATGLLR